MGRYGASIVTFENQVVLVTGAGRGLGSAYARLIAARDGFVVVHDGGVERDGTGGNPAPAREVAESIRTAGGEAEAETQNLETREACEELISAILERHGQIDALVHNAGIVRYQGIVDTSAGEWQRMLDVNIGAAWWLCRALWPTMTQRRYGRIALTTSGFALRPIAGADVTGYSVGKAAQWGLMNALAAEGDPFGVYVNAVAPVAATRIYRRVTEAGEMTPESVAPGVAFLASRDCRWTGQVLVAQDGTYAIDTMHRSEVADLGQNARPEDVHRYVDGVAEDWFGRSDVG